MRRIVTALCCSLLGPVACKVEIERDQDTVPLAFKVKIREPVGSESEPLPYTTAPRTFTIDVEAVDFHGQDADWFNGDVYLDVAPRGRLAKGQARTITLRDGKATGVAVSVEKVHGASNVWVEDRGSDDKPGSYATGLSPTLHVNRPTLHDISETTNISSSALRGDFVHVNNEGRRLVATGIAVDGFYLTDLDEPTGTFNAIFAHTHSRPNGVEQGDIIVDIIGTVGEFYGFTELSFPTYKVGGHVDELPTAKLTTQTIADDLAMEALESRLVELENVTICPIGEGYHEFGQWVVVLDDEGGSGNCSSGEGGITIVSALSATGFTPEGHEGETITRLLGDLRYHVAARPPWIIYTRGDADIELE
ncbi:MAG: hypothetical protein JNL82_34275 [Myxococcales bacterium]|nr:hypothetical protein [Myxococcales bacterium]